MNVQDNRRTCISNSMAVHERWNFKLIARPSMLYCSSTIVSQTQMYDGPRSMSIRLAWFSIGICDRPWFKASNTLLEHLKPHFTWAFNILKFQKRLPNCNSSCTYNLDMYASQYVLMVQTRQVRSTVSTLQSILRSVEKRHANNLDPPT
jgi:hypothetical protein